MVKAACYIFVKKNNGFVVLAVSVQDPYYVVKDLSHLK